MAKKQKREETTSPGPKPRRSGSQREAEAQELKDSDLADYDEVSEPESLGFPRAEALGKKNEKPKTPFLSAGTLLLFYVPAKQS